MTENGTHKSVRSGATHKTVCWSASEQVVSVLTTLLAESAICLDLVALHGLFYFFNDCNDSPYLLEQT